MLDKKFLLHTPSFCIKWKYSLLKFSGNEDYYNSLTVCRYKMLTDMVRRYLTLQLYYC